MTYILVITLLFVFSYVHDICGVEEKKKRDYIIVFWIFFLLTGLRHGIGNDTYQYRIFWELLPTFDNFSWRELTSYRYEVGWVLLCFLVKSTLGSFVFWQLMVSWVLNKGLFRVVGKYTKYPFVVLLLFFIAGEQFYYIEFEFMRQSVSVAIFLFWGVKYLEEGKRLKYILTVVVCTLFHFSSVVLIVFVYLWNVNFNNRKDRKMIFTISAIGVISIFLLYNWGVLDLIQASERFANDVENLASGDKVVGINKIIYMISYNFIYFIIIVWGITAWKIKVEFHGALIFGTFVCLISPFSFDSVRLMFFIVIFVDFILADFFVRFSRSYEDRKLSMFSFSMIFFMIISNVAFFMRFSDSQQLFKIYPYYSWFEEEPDSHFKYYNQRKNDGTTVNFQIYKTEIEVQ